MSNNKHRYITLNEIEKIAKVCHEVNRAFCRSLGDTSQPCWDDAPDWQKSSARKGVCSLVHGSPEVTHEHWLKEKTDNGWKYGPAKDAEKKEHPCILPYNELPRDQQTKDALFAAVVEAMRD